MEITLEAEKRQGTGKGVARKLRAAGKVPGVLYGAGGSSVALAVSRRDLSHALATDAGLNVLLDLAIDGESFLTLARELQRNPLRGDITHVDFLKVDRNVAIEVDVPIRVEGDPVGVREGGVVEHHLWTVSVSCLPGNVPEHIDVDISNLQLFEHLRVGDLVAPEGVTILTDADEQVVTIATPQVLKVEAELDQPEVEAPVVPVEGEGAAGAAGAGAAGGAAEGA